MDSASQAIPIPAAPSADIWVAEVRVSNFRNIVDTRIALDRSVTFLVGENNTGKSALLDAIATACGSRRPMQDDLRRTDQEIAAEAIVDLVIRPVALDFEDPVIQRLDGNTGPGPREGEWAAIRMRLTRSHESPFLASRRSFLAWDEAAQDWYETGRHPTTQAMDLITAHTVEASRDLAAELLRRTSDWGRVLTNLGISASVRQELETRLRDLSDELREASPTLKLVAEQLLEMRNAQSTVEEVQIHPLPDRIEDLIHSTDVAIGGGVGTAALPMRLQGLGSRSLATLRVYFALCELRIGADKGVRPHLITLLEEPEAHLHPQAQAAVHRSVREIPGQVIVATHSPVLIGEADLEAVRVLRTATTGVEAHHLNPETAKKVAVFRRYISRPLGELFFARLVILVDGAAERTTIPPLLGSAMGRDIAGLGVTLLDMQGQKSEWMQKVIEALHRLGEIPWLAFVDNDSDGLKAIEGCTGMDGEPLSAEHPQVVMSGKKQLEQLLLDSGYHEEIRSIANEHASWQEPHPQAGEPRLPPFTLDEEASYLDFLTSTKGWSGELVAIAAVQNGHTPPEPIVELAARVEEAIAHRAITTDIAEDEDGVPP